MYIVVIFLVVRLEYTKGNSMKKRYRYVIDCTEQYPNNISHHIVFVAIKVAVKILFCIELTPERVVAFCSEVGLLHSLQHPNIVQCYGVSVMPPAICMVW
jgi:hypothetical protein